MESLENYIFRLSAFLCKVYGFILFLSFGQLKVSYFIKP